MRKVIMYFMFAVTIISFVSCARGITVDEAANGKAKCGRYLR
jgi:hypothetical protein